MCKEQGTAMAAAARVIVTALAVPGFFVPCLFVLSLFTPAARAGDPPPLPHGFVRLGEVAPGIRQDMRYARSFNFTGGVVPGYDGPQCILLRPAAMALQRAEALLEAEGFMLQVYDCYRPVRAVKAFAAWAQRRGGDSMKAVFFPGFDKAALFALGYIAAHSRHSLGTTVDIGLVRRDDGEVLAPETGGRCDGPFEARARESTLDMGTAYDCFSTRSATASPQIPAEARANRERLRRAMEKAGFRNYAREWWHFEYVAGPSQTVAHDFPVQ
jgi:D-alanyl-D-alanine dipeptidase